MTPEITTRSFTNDQTIFNKIFFDNFYKLKGEKDSSKIFLDLGAHAGYFAFTALSLGARKVYCIEPFVDSFKILLENCYNYYFVGRITPYQVGVYVENTMGKFSVPKLIDNIYFDMDSIGLVENENEEDFYPCQCVSLDDILKIYCYDEKIDVLKINIGYAEREILLSSKLLDQNVDSICGQVSLTKDEFVNFKKEMGIKGFTNSFSKEISDVRSVFWFSKKALNENFNI